MDKAVLIFLKRIIKADKLLDKELFLKFTNREKAEYINLIANHRNGREAIIINDNHYYDADDNSFIEESNLDVERLVYKELLINMPMKVLCSEDCQGISNRCGSDDTTELDPRMSKIKDIFNKFKEV